MKKLTVIIPAFNEAGAIGETLKELLPYAEKNDWKIIVTNDGSTDGTGKILAGIKGITVLHHKVNKGYGASLKTGILKAKTALVAFFDADGQHTPKDLEKMWNKYSDQDMLVGARARGSHFSLSRAPGKWVLSVTANFLAGKKIPDLNSGLRIVKRETILKYLHLFPDGFSMSTTSTIALISDKRTVDYIKIRTKKRIGTSSVNQIRDGSNAVLLILRLIVLFNPLKVFLPASIILFFTGVVYEIIWGYYLSPHLKLLPGALMTILTSIIIFFFALIMDQISQIRRNVIKQ
ncbi:MAG: glycosyltransferase family 2 protein [Candidatus Delongbacteria bacterium]